MERLVIKKNNNNSLGMVLLLASVVFSSLTQVGRGTTPTPKTDWAF